VSFTLGKKERTKALLSTHQPSLSICLFKRILQFYTFLRH